MGALVAALVTAGLPGASSVAAAGAGLQVVAVGSPTAQSAVDTVLADAVAAYDSANSVTDTAWDLHVPTPAGSAALTYAVPADPNCAAAHTYSTAAPPPAGDQTTPDGSSAGVAALVADEADNWPTTGAGAGCVALARSEIGPQGAGLDGSSKLVFDAFALDAVSWASASIYAPPTLSQAQVAGIYTCAFTDWGQVGGIPGHPIQRYLPRVGSDLRAVFISQLLGGTDPTSISSSTPPAGSTFACPTVISTQLDHAGAPLQPDDGTGLDVDGYQSAILPYDASAWILQANNHLNPSIDRRNGVRLGAITPTGPTPAAASFLRWNTSGVWEPNSLNASNPTAPVNDAQTPESISANGPPANVYAGVHYQWLVSDAANPDYSLAQSLVGFTNQAGGARSSLCANGERGTLVGQGYSALSATAGGAADLAGATCRQYREPGPSLWAWGYDLYGHLGDGGTANQSSPERIAPTQGWASVSTGYYESAAITTDGQLYTWGDNTAGQLGDGTTTNQSSPEHIGTTQTWASVSVHYLNGAAITTSGQLYVWGDNSSGQLGDGTTTASLTPEQIAPTLTWASVSVGLETTAALTTTGQLYVWGSNADGSVGDGTTDDQHVPEQIDPSLSWASVSAGDLDTTAITTTGQLYTWGYNQFGQVGNGTVANQLSPTPVAPSQTWASVSAGSYDSAAITTTGQLYTWGYNSHGELGDGTTSTRTTPEAIAPGQTWASVSAGDLDTAAITTSGQLFAWGYNGFGQLGDGPGPDVYAPQQVGTASDWRSVAVWNFAATGIRAAH